MSMMVSVTFSYRSTYSSTYFSMLGHSPFGKSLLFQSAIKKISYGRVGWVGSGVKSNDKATLARFSAELRFHDGPSLAIINRGRHFLPLFRSDNQRV